MAKTRVQEFFGVLDSILESTSSTKIKATIGDSTNNNRTPTVKQVVRFLNKTGKKKLAAQLEVVYNELKWALAQNRDENNNRTDAFDINEFMYAFETYTLEGGTYARRHFGDLIKVA